MQAVPVTEAFFSGAVSVEKGDGWLRPWRLPCEQLPLFISPGDTLVGQARQSSGVRLRFMSDATAVQLTFLPLAPPVCPMHNLDLTIDDQIVATAAVAEGGTQACFSGLPAGDTCIEVWLPQSCGIDITGLSVSDGAHCAPLADERPVWITYGSSLTHSRRANGSARTWPGIVSRRLGLNLMLLGYAGDCCLEPGMAMMIRDLPAAVITLKLGINCIGGALAPRTFGAAVMGMVRIIREKQPTTPLWLISPLAFPPNENAPNAVGNTVPRLRADIEEVYARLTARGDSNLYYANGLDLFSMAEIATYSQDQCHPNGDGIVVQAENFLRFVAARFPVGGG